jgi:hypothetical protein
MFCVEDVHNVIEHDIDTAKVIIISLLSIPIEQQNEFLKNNEQLVKEYLMLD